MWGTPSAEFQADEELSRIETLSQIQIIAIIRKRLVRAPIDTRVIAGTRTDERFHMWGEFRRYPPETRLS